MQHSLEFATLQERNKGRACKRPGKGASKALLKELHRHKMMGKHFRRYEVSGAPGASYHPAKTETEKAQYERTRSTPRRK